MGIFDEIGRAAQQIDRTIRNADPDRAQGTTGRSEDFSRSAKPPRAPHPGYSRITAWIRTTYPGKLPVSDDPYQKRLELELLVSEATRDLPARTRKGFTDYLKSQDYEQLLR